ncbi:MAG: DNA primase [Candidatus Omnitrophota bacterium]
MAFSEQVLDEIQNKCDIVEVIGSYIPLKRAGRNFKAPCPFHKEKTPSFMVSPSKQIFHCFGCGAGGNVFNFVMKFEGVEFPEAVRMLAEKVGIELPRFTHREFEQSTYASQIFKLNELAASYYHLKLLKSEEGKRPLNYLKGRDIKDEVITQAKLGFAPDSWDGFINYAKDKGFELGLLERAGLISPREEGGYYDNFRNRIIFPILDIKNRVLAFGARVLDDSLPKYINSPETEIYIKGRHLYGLNFSVAAIKEKDFCIVVEGYLDFLIPYQYGIKNIVASSGTSLTDTQVRLMKRYTKNVIMVYDGDQAGEAASLRGLDLFVQEGLNVRIVSLPKGYDPDLFVRKKGASEFNALIDSAKDLFDYKLGLLTSRYDAYVPRDKSTICTEMLPTIAKITNAVLKYEYIKRLADRLQVKEEALLLELKKVKPDYTYELPKDFSKGQPQGALAEKIIIGLMLDQPEVIPAVKSSLKLDDLVDEKARRIADEIFKSCEDGKVLKPTQLINRLKDESLSQMISEATSLADEITDVQKNLDDCIRWIKNQNIKTKLAELQNLIKVAQAMGDEKRVCQLILEYNSLLKGPKEPARR